MSWELIIAFNVTLIAAILSPGPAMLVSIRTTLLSGRKQGILIGFGLGLMAAIWTCMALFGLDSVFKLFPWAYTGAKIIGAAYLLYIAWNTWKHASKQVEVSQLPKANAFWEGILLNLSNPKSVLFAAAVLVVIFPPELGLAAKMFIVANQFVIEIIFYTMFAFIMSTQTISKKYLSAKIYFDRFAAIVLGGLGIRLLLQR